MTEPVIVEPSFVDPILDLALILDEAQLQEAVRLVVDSYVQSDMKHKRTTAERSAAAKESVARRRNGAMWIAYAQDRITPLVRTQNKKAMEKYVRAHLDEVSFVEGPDGRRFQYNRKAAQLIPEGDERWQRR